jgi:hypothetical protein
MRGGGMRGGVGEGRRGEACGQFSSVYLIWVWPRVEVGLGFSGQAE